VTVVFKAVHKFC